MNIKMLSFLIAVAISASLLWRNSGEKFTFDLPTSMTLVEGKKQAPREIKFYRHWPVFGWFSPREIEPSLQVGAIIQVDLSSSEITWFDWFNDSKSLRITQRVDEESQRTYFLKMDRLVKDAKSVTLRIKNNEFIPSDAIHQQDWYWVREFYDCEVVTSS